MKDAIQSTNEVIGDEAAPVPGGPIAGQRTVVQRVRERLGDFIGQATAAAALIVVFIFLSFASPVFLTTDNLINIIEQNAVTATIALGMTFVIITAGIDLSVGSTAAMTGVVGVELVAHGWHWPPAMLIAILLGGVVGLINGVLISFARLNPFITTLGMMTVVRGLTDVYTNAVVVVGPTSELGPQNFGVIGLGKVSGIPVALIILVVLSALAYFLLSHTRLGRYTYAIGSNQEAARLSGIPVKRYLLAVYVILGLLTGLAGVIAVSRLSIAEPNFGIGLELDVIAATVVGGASLFGGQGTIVGTLIGVFLIGVIRDGSVLLDINSFWQNVIIGVVIWLAVLWDQFRRRRISSLSS
jgi:ribose transport system permease protein